MTMTKSGDSGAASAAREDMLRCAAQRSKILGVVMRRAIQQLRSDPGIERLPAGAPSAATHDTLPEIGRAQFLVLRLLATAGPLAVGEIAKRCHVAGPTISRMLNQLEGIGLIERRNDPVRRRVTRVVLTEAGYAREAAMTRRLEAALERMLSPLTDAELADLITAFGHLERLVADADSIRRERSDD